LPSSSAPSGGLDPSKLPDILGVHIGTPTDKVIAQLNSLYPFVRHGTGAVESGSMGNGYIKYAPTNDPPYVSSTGYFKPNTAGCSPSGCQANDTMRAIFSGPPEKVVVKLQRMVSFDSGKMPTTDTLKAALIQKYGANFTAYPDAFTLQWAFDEEGKALPPPNKPVSCQGILSQQGYPGTSDVPGGPFTPNNPQMLDSYLGIVPGTPPQQQQQQPQQQQGHQQGQQQTTASNPQPSPAAAQAPASLQDKGRKKEKEIGLAPKKRRNEEEVKIK